MSQQHMRLDLLSVSMFWGKTVVEKERDLITCVVKVVPFIIRSRQCFSTLSVTFDSAEKALIRLWNKEKNVVFPEYSVYTLNACDWFNKC